jgi:hypothetical protein
VSTGGGAKSDLFNNSSTAQNLSNNLTANAANLYGTAAPVLQAEAAHPQGMAPTDLAAANTAAQQSAGGSQAGAVGQGALLASRTKNAGTADAAIAKSTENAGGLLSKAALGTQLNNANLKQRQQQAGMSGLTSLYGTTLGAGENALGLSNSALGTIGNIDVNNPWFKIGQQGIQSAGQVGAAAIDSSNSS